MWYNNVEMKGGVVAPPSELLKKKCSNSDRNSKIALSNLVNSAKSFLFSRFMELHTSFISMVLSPANHLILFRHHLLLDFIIG
jgi:hypothetical protein